MKLIAPNGPLRGEVELPISKSIANRYLIISALAQSVLELPPSLPDDVRIMRQALNSEETTVHIGMAGTAMRFLTAYFAVLEGREVVLTGDARMKERPIAELVHALRTLGAEVAYLGNEGFPPLRIRGKKLKGGNIGMSATVSSQFISALMMVGPKMENGLQLELKGKILSEPYIRLTMECMRNCGAEILIGGNIITISKTDYSVPELELETDWSAASYFYAMAAIRPRSKLLLKGLKLNSPQGDAVLADWFRQMGIFSVQQENGVEIVSTEDVTFPTQMDFFANPDLAQTVAFLAVALGKKITLRGLDNLRLKETDRIAALQAELTKVGAMVSVDGNTMVISGSRSTEEMQIKTYHDHRMAMSASVLSVGAAEKMLSLQIEDPQVVEKSFPSFWQQLQLLGFKIGS